MISPPISKSLREMQTTIKAVTTIIKTRYQWLAVITEILRIIAVIIILVIVIKQHNQ